MIPTQTLCYSIGQVIPFHHQSLKIESFLAQGGFAQVFGVALLDSLVEKRVLKRVYANDSFTLESCQNEIKFMQLLSNQRNIVRFDGYVMNPVDNGYEVLILMEYCAGGHLVDFLNTRLQNRLQEYEVLHIFSQICEAVSYLHTLNPPILHRDIKVENVLIATDGSFKLCDFGSATTRTILPGTLATVKDIHQMQDEINRVTTLQYRAPELCDLYQKMGISVKTTPFEESGPLGIVNAKFEFPSQPTYSASLKKLVSVMLNPKPDARPTALQLVELASRLKSRSYHGDPFDLLANNQPTSMPTTNITAPTAQPVPTSGIPNGIHLSSPQDITPMRRGRPVPKSGQLPVSASVIQAIAQQTQPDPFTDLLSGDTHLPTTTTTASASNLTKTLSSFDPFDPSSFHPKERSDPISSHSSVYHVKDRSAGSMGPSIPASRTSLHEDIRSTQSSPFMNYQQTSHHRRDPSANEAPPPRFSSHSNLGESGAFDDFTDMLKRGHSKQSSSVQGASFDSFSTSFDPGFPSSSSFTTPSSYPIQPSPQFSPSFVSMAHHQFGMAQQAPSLDLSSNPPPKPPRSSSRSNSVAGPMLTHYGASTDTSRSLTPGNYTATPGSSPVKSAPLPSWEPLISLPSTQSSTTLPSTTPLPPHLLHSSPAYYPRSADPSMQSAPNQPYLTASTRKM